MTSQRETRPEGNRARFRAKNQGSTEHSRRAANLRACGQAYAHLKAHGLVSEIVVRELQRILREAS